jgi:hypothetical protein
MFARFRRWIGSIGLFTVLLVSGAHGTPANGASTDNCLASPTSPAPAGSHWFYRMDLQSAVKCWYLRMLGQPEQKTSARDRPTTASHMTAPHGTASHVAASDGQLIRRPSTSMLGAGSPGIERSTRRDDSASPSPDVGMRASAVGPRSRASVGASAGESFARTAQDDASSPSIELIRVRNSNELPVGDQAAGPRPPVRVVWPVPVSEVQPAEVSKADAKDQSARMVSPEADAAVNASIESAVRPGEGASGTSRMGQLAVLIFLSFGLPGAGLLAWVVMRADNTRGEQLAGTHFHATGADDRRSENKRRARGLDARREAARLDDFLAHLAEHPTTRVRKAGVASVGPVQPRADVTEAVLRNILRAFRHKAAAEYDSGSYSTAQRRMAAL